MWGLGFGTRIAIPWDELILGFCDREEVPAASRSRRILPSCNGPGLNPVFRRSLGRFSLAVDSTRSGPCRDSLKTRGCLCVSILITLPVVVVCPKSEACPVAEWSWEAALFCQSSSSPILPRHAAAVQLNFSWQLMRYCNRCHDTRNVLVART